ncbi:MAG: hypothetical protein O7D94_13030, partial [Planctomycetota bacterium]|nr:hypothetical protein [Planctomycetota bacterium]
MTGGIDHCQNALNKTMIAVNSDRMRGRFNEMSLSLSGRIDLGNRGKVTRVSPFTRTSVVMLPDEAYRSNRASRIPPRIRLFG